MREKLFSEYPQIRARIAQEIRFKRDVIRRIYTYEAKHQRRFRVSNFRDALVNGINIGLFSRKMNRIIDPDSLVTQFDRDDDYSREQYKKGLKIGSNAQTVFIAINNVWASRNKDESHTASYEKLGYHRSTKELYQGFLDSGVEIMIY